LKNGPTAAVSRIIDLVERSNEKDGIEHRSTSPALGIKPTRP
jgi:hypothetical protein